MVYTFKPGSFIRADAQTAGEMCERLASEGRLTARDLVEENRPEDAPLHDEFEWDNDAAADRWREHQARHIINCLVVRKDTSEPVRAFFNIERTAPTYTHIETILRSADDTKILLDKAFRELQIFRKKYQTLEELADIFAAIDRVLPETEETA